MSFEKLSYAKTWDNPADFPTYEDSEAQVRADLQYHPDAIKEFINGFLTELESEAGAGSIGVDGGTLQAVLDSYLERFERVDDDIRLVAAGSEPGTGKAVSSYHKVFEPGDWVDGKLYVPKSEHGMTPADEACICTVRMRVGRNARDYASSSQLPEVKTALVGIEAAALAANAATPGTYPVNEADGHVLLSWEQMQYYLLEGTLASTSAAATAAAEKGFDWSGRDTLGVAETVTLDQLLTAAYLPALGGSSTQLDALLTLEAVQGLRLRRRQEDVATEAATLDHYDLDGKFMTTWGTLATDVRWDLATQNLVLSAQETYPGDLVVMG